MSDAPPAATLRTAAGTHRLVHSQLAFDPQLKLAAGADGELCGEGNTMRYRCPQAGDDAPRGVVRPPARAGETSGFGRVASR